MTEQPVTSGRGDLLLRRLSWAVAGIGILIALVSFAGGRSLWLDEAMITLNLRDLSWSEMTSSLQYEQMAPIGWLALQRLLLEATHNLEYGLRASSLLAWAGAVLLFRDICSRQFSPLVALLGTGLFAFCAPLLMFAVELKHYEFDVLVATAALWCGVRLLSGAKPEMVSWLAFAATVLFGVFFSFGGVFAIGATGLALLLRFGLARDWVRAGAVVALGVVALAIFLWLMLGLYRPMLSGSGLQQGGTDAFFTRTSFLPLPTSLGNLLWLPNWLWEFLLFVFHQDSRFAAAILIGAGGVLLALRNREMLILGLGPLAIGMLASATHAYPMLERLALFTLPGLLLMMAFALAWVAERMPSFRLGPIALFALAMVGSGLDTAYKLRQSPPYANHENRPVLAALQAQAQPGDRIYIENFFIPAWLVYRGQYGFGDRIWTVGQTNRVSWGCMIRDMQDLSSVKTLWAVVVQARGEITDDELADALAYQGLTGKHEVVAETSGVTLHRIELSPRGAPATPYPSRQCGEDGTGTNRVPPQRFRDETMRFVPGKFGF